MFTLRHIIIIIFSTINNNFSDDNNGHIKLVVTYDQTDTVTIVGVLYYQAEYAEQHSDNSENFKQVRNYIIKDDMARKMFQCGGFDVDSWTYITVSKCCCILAFLFTTNNNVDSSVFS